VTLRNKFFKSGKTKLKGGNIIVNIKEREFFFFHTSKNTGKSQANKKKKRKMDKKERYNARHKRYRDQQKRELIKLRSFYYTFASEKYEKIVNEFEIWFTQNEQIPEQKTNIPRAVPEQVPEQLTNISRATSLEQCPNGYLSS
jgi:hypothetical protein